jgi:two-component system, NarL family, nitrate/nitrite response regulator NarL
VPGDPRSRSLLRRDSPRGSVRLAVVSPIRLYREGLAASLAATGRVDVVAVCLRVAPSLPELTAADPDIVLLDASADDAGVAVRMLAGAVPGARVVALAVVETEADVIPLAEAGVAGYLTVDQSLAELTETIVAVARGETPCSPALAGMLLRRVAALAGSGAPERAALTRREEQILALLGRGLSNKEIARDLQIGLPTVKNHVHHILEKLDVTSRSAAAARARI